MTTVHPRSRGEYVHRSDLAVGRVGSSPLARGTRVILKKRRYWIRFIPARAGNTEFEVTENARRPVHPRSRGEHRPIRTRTSRFSGSSPLARGTQIDPGVAIQPDRFIPARAGNTSRSVVGGENHPVHPRSRGEHFPIRSGRGKSPGSSPLARGTRSDGRCSRRASRFIPARAGNTTRTGSGSPTGTVHPRSRGEHRLAPRWPSNTAGSSPLARGTRDRGLILRGVYRFIPARAGNTSRSPCEAPSPTVHPRSRGEHEASAQATPRVTGSSPLARGTQIDPGVAIQPDRFIPARAGNTLGRQGRVSGGSVHPRSRGEHLRLPYLRLSGVGSSPLARGTPRPGSSPRSSTPVHPRSRGEHIRVTTSAAPEIGSSPLARGTLERMARWCDEQRFIPARAGNTWRTRRSGSSRPVHPRSRGEHLIHPGNVLAGTGSSPLARGTHPEGPALVARERFIPARAGNTAPPY